MTAHFKPPVAAEPAYYTVEVRDEHADVLLDSRPSTYAAFDQLLASEMHKDHDLTLLNPAGLIARYRSGKEVYLCDERVTERDLPSGIVAIEDDEDDICGPQTAEDLADMRYDEERNGEWD